MTDSLMERHVQERGWNKPLVDESQIENSLQVVQRRLRFLKSSLSECLQSVEQLKAIIRSQERKLEKLLIAKAEEENKITIIKKKSRARKPERTRDDLDEFLSKLSPEELNLLKLYAESRAQ